MGLTTAEIRDRAERFQAAAQVEIYQTRAGRKAWLELAPLYEAQSILAASETLPVIERAIASADADEERRLRRLLRWAARHHLQATNARLDDEYSYWRISAKVETGSAVIPMSQASSQTYATEGRNARKRLDEARCLILEEGLPLQLDRMTRWRETAMELGYGGYREAVERLAGVNLQAVQLEARRFLDETEDLYREHLREQLSSRVGIAPEDAESHDAGWLTRMRWLDGACQDGQVLGTISKDLRDIGFPLEVGGHIVLEHEAFPGPGMMAFCAPLKVPERINLMVMPSITQPGCLALLGAVGKSLHYAYTDAGLLFEDRALGDLAVPLAHAQLFASLGRLGPWVRRACGLEGNALEAYVRASAFADLYALREAAGRLQFELEMAESRQPAAMGPRWAEIIGTATGFRYDPRAFLERLGQRFGVARYFRCRMLEAVLRRQLRERFDDDWYRNPLTGPFLGQWFASGVRFTAAEHASRLGASRLEANALIASARESLA